ncbi:hypothetical protein SLE2022_003780 [Rubroshorea leprosula]
MACDRVRLCVGVVFCAIAVVYSATDPNDLKILLDFKKGLENPDLLEWPDNGDDPCGTPLWPHVFCEGNRVSQIQVQNMGLMGPLPQNFNQLTKLSNLGLQRNRFYGKLPTFSGLSELEFAFLNENEFDTIPSDFFDGLSSLRVLALDKNPLNATTGWSIPKELANSVQLVNISMMQCNLVGPIPDFLGKLPGIVALQLSYNNLSGEIPASFGDSLMQILWLNNQDGGGMSGTIDVISKMETLSQLWLHGNQFTGTIPEDIGNLVTLKDLNLNDNKLVGLVPESLAKMELDNLVLNNNLLMGPIPKLTSGNFSYASNLFCQSEPGVPCAPEVTALLDFLGGLNYPVNLVSLWSGNDPCGGRWMGLSCNPQSKVSVINLPRHNLSGTLSPSVAKLDSLTQVRLGGNSIHGTVPMNFIELESLVLLDLSGNNLEPPLPKFHDSVKVVTEGNPLLSANQTTSPPSPPSTPLPIPPPAGSPPTLVPISPPKSPPDSGGVKSPPPKREPSPGKDSDSSPDHVEAPSNDSKIFKLLMVVGVTIVFVLLLVLILSYIYCCKKRKSSQAPNVNVVHPKDPSDSENNVKIAVSDTTSGSLNAQIPISSRNSYSSATTNSHVIHSGNLVISVQALRKVTKNFAQENELGRGGFGTVYKAELEDGTKLAVKRMKSRAVNNKAVDEFKAEIDVLSKVRHRHLVSLWGYCIEDNENLLVYEYMPEGALSKHLFHWKHMNLKPLSWTQRLTIALDVARGMEYLHGLAHETFIHRDLKSSNILLDNHFRAKVSDFGLVKLAPGRGKSIVTKLAGTFGYLAPEYAVMGKITTKVDVFSYGVVLMELLTGLTVLDEERPVESHYLVHWFWRTKSSMDKLRDALDPALEHEILESEETLKTISIIAELAIQCTAREPNHRPEMGHVVNVLAPLVEKWKPIDHSSDESCAGIDINYNIPLLDMLKGWKEAGTQSTIFTSDDSTGSIPARPVGFAASFNSSDAR